MALFAVESGAAPRSTSQQIKEAGLWLGRQIISGANSILAKLEVATRSVWAQAYPFITSRYGPVIIGLTATSAACYAFYKAHNERMSKSALVQFLALALLSGVGAGVAVGRALYLPV